MKSVCIRYRGLVAFRGNASDGRNFSQCDSLLIGNKGEASTFPYIEAADGNNQVEHEATTSRVSEEQPLGVLHKFLSVSGFCT